MTFRFSKKKKISAPKSASVRAKILRDEEAQPPFFVRGQKAGSKDEYWVSLALDKIQEETGWGWDYQVPVYGGRTVAGGNVIDFLVYTPGRWSLLDPMGRYWHTGKNEDRNQMANVARRKKWNLIAWFTDETPTKQSVLILLKDKLTV